MVERNAEIAGDKRIIFRIGVNLGDVIIDGDDIFGDGVNIAARLEGLAEAGGICISRGVHDHIRRKLPYGFENLGEQSVKNITQPIRVFPLIADAAKGESPSGREIYAAATEAADHLPTLAAPSESALEPQSVELVFWDSIKDSTREADYEAYLAQPEGSFVS